MKLEQIKATIQQKIQCQSGATAVEYGLIIGLMALGLAAASGELATITNDIFNMIFQETDAVAQTVTTQANNQTPTTP